MSSALSTNLECGCGRIFVQHNALSNHQRNCRTTNGRVVDVLRHAKDMLRARKRPRLDNENSGVPCLVADSVTPVSSSRPEEVCLLACIQLNGHLADRICSKASKTVLNVQLDTTVQANPAPTSDHVVHVGIFLCPGVSL